MNALEITNLTCRFGSRTALDNLSLNVAHGTVLGIVGPNGAGKTTLIETICGLTRPTQGRIQLLGEDVKVVGAKLRARIGVLPQETALYDEVSALQNLRFAAALYNVENEEARIREVLNLVGLQPRASDIVKTFSGGMQRRLAIARALLHKPELLILDEPTIGVDVEARHQIWSHIRTLKANGATVILTTNYLDEAEALCDQMLILRSGQVLAHGSPAELTAKTGRCLELTCTDEQRLALIEAFKTRGGILRVEPVDFGLNLYLAPSLNPEDLVKEARLTCPIEHFRSRSPDLAEMFLSLSAERGV